MHVVSMAPPPSNLSDARRALDGALADLQASVGCFAEGLRSRRMPIGSDEVETTSVEVRQRPDVKSTCATAEKRDRLPANPRGIAPESRSHTSDPPLGNTEGRDRSEDASSPPSTGHRMEKPAKESLGTRLRSWGKLFVRTMGRLRGR